MNHANPGKDRGRWTSVLAEEEEAAAAAAAANEDYQLSVDENMVDDDDDLTLLHFDRGQFHGAPARGAEPCPRSRRMRRRQ